MGLFREESVFEKFKKEVTKIIPRKKSKWDKGLEAAEDITKDTVKIFGEEMKNDLKNRIRQSSERQSKQAGIDAALVHWKELHDKGLIDEQEYKAKKRDILSRE